jgi:hypothetical protein
MLLGIWILKSRAFFAKVRPDKLAEQILLMLVLYSSIHKGAMRQTGVLHSYATVTPSKPRSRNRRAPAAKICNRYSATCSPLTFMCVSEHLDFIHDDHHKYNHDGMQNRAMSQSRDRCL